MTLQFKPKPAPVVKLQKLLTTTSPNVYTWPEIAKQKWFNITGEAEANGDLRPFEAFQLAQLWRSHDPDHEAVNAIYEDLKIQLFKLK